MSRRWKLGCAALVLTPVVAAAIFIAIYWTPICRLCTYPWGSEVTAVEWYEPRETVTGNFTTALPSRAADELGFDEAKLSHALDLAQQYRSSAFLVLRRGQIALEHYGKGCGPDVPTNSFSMAKTLLALLCGIAIEHGEIDSIDDPVERYLEEWRGQPRGAIRLRDLLWMQSGLLYDNDRDDPFCAMVQMHIGTDILPILLAQEPTRAPGLDHEYNNLNAQTVGVILERTCQHRYAELLSTRIWSHIGARDASVWLDAEDGLAKMYGCVFARARDWARVGELVRLRGRVGDSQLISPTWFDRIEAASPHRREYGMYIWRGDPDPERRLPAFVYLDGKSKQRVFIVRDLDLVVVRTGENTKGWSDQELLGRVTCAIVE